MNVHFKGGKGSGFVDNEGNLFLTRCPRCERENYAAAVASGICAWCQWEEGDPVEVEK